MQAIWRIPSSNVTNKLDMKSVSRVNWTQHVYMVSPAFQCASFHAQHEQMANFSTKKNPTVAMEDWIKYVSTSYRWQVSKNADVLVGYLAWLLRVPLLPRCSEWRWICFNESGCCFTFSTFYTGIITMGCPLKIYKKEGSTFEMQNWNQLNVVSNRSRIVRRAAANDGIDERQFSIMR